MAGNYGSRTLLWSSEGGGLCNTPNATASTALAAAVKAASGVSDLIDVQGARELLIEVILTSFTGGASPSFLPEWDFLDDAVSANSAPLWKPGAAVTVATKWLTWLGGQGLGTAPTITGWTATVIPVGFGAQGQLKWTIAGAPTAVAWVAYVYGK